MQRDILIVDDEADIRNLIQGILEDEGYETRLAANSQEAAKATEERAPALVVLDIWLQGSEKDGLEILEDIKRDFPNVPVVMISGHGTIETAVNSIKIGAYDFIEKPFKSDRLLLMIKRALETAELRRENEVLKQTVRSPVDLIGSSASITNLKQIIERVAPTNSRVLLTGEPGTGKDIVSRVIHRCSQRADGPFMVLNCATMQPERLEKELFGVAASGDEPAQAGVLEQADGGTLVLDEVSDMPMETQGKIVRVLQEQRFQKIKSDRFSEVDVRILATTNRDLEAVMNEGKFRQDLYYRLNVVPVEMPALSERKEDIPDLCAYFTESYGAQSGRKTGKFNRKALDMLQAYDWPGNIRQLRNVVEWTMIMHAPSENGSYGPECLPPEIRGEQTPDQQQDNQKQESSASSKNPAYLELPLREAREFFERHYLQMQVDRFEGNISRTSEFVGMERSALHRKLKSLQIMSGGNAQNETAQKKRA